MLSYYRDVAGFENAYPDASINSINTGSGYATPAEVMLDRKASDMSVNLAKLYARACDAIAGGDREAAHAALVEINGILSKSGGVSWQR